MSGWVLSISKDEVSAASLDSLFCCSFLLRVEKKILMFNNLLYFLFWLLPLVFSLGTTKKSWLSFLPLTGIHTLEKILTESSLLQTKQSPALACSSMVDTPASHLHSPFVGLQYLHFCPEGPRIGCSIFGVVPPVLSQKKKYIYCS